MTQNQLKWLAMQEDVRHNKEQEDVARQDALAKLSQAESAARNATTKEAELYKAETPFGTVHLGSLYSAAVGKSGRSAGMTDVVRQYSETVSKKKNN